jgi:hypothetical protein
MKTACPSCNRPNTVAPGCVTCGNSYCQEAHHFRTLALRAKTKAARAEAAKRALAAEANVERYVLHLSLRGRA